MFTYNNEKNLQILNYIKQYLMMLARTYTGKSIYDYKITAAILNKK